VNGKFRDDLRALSKGTRIGLRRHDAHLRQQRLFPDDIMSAYHAYQSVNFITCHDGFCLYDLVSYNRKHNEANGHYNTDGADYNLSWNCGWRATKTFLRGHGPPQASGKNFCCLLFLSNGTPMFSAGMSS